MSRFSTTAAAVRDAIRRHPWWTDSLLALFLTVFSVASAIVAKTRYGHPVPVLDVILVTSSTAPIAVRRYRPLAVLVVTVTAAVLALILTSQSQFPVGVLVALYTVASRCERPVSIRAGEWVALPITVAISDFCSR